MPERRRPTLSKSLSVRNRSRRLDESLRASLHLEDSIDWDASHSSDPSGSSFAADDGLEETRILPQVTEEEHPFPRATSLGRWVKPFSNFNGISTYTSRNSQCRTIIPIKSICMLAGALVISAAMVGLLALKDEPVPPLIAFQSRDELWEAIDAYLQGGEATKTVQQKYGANMNHWNVSHVTDFSGLFKFRTEFNENISAWDVSRGTSFSELFYEAEEFNIPLDMWDISSATDLSYMFALARRWNQPLESWSTGKVRTFQGMFFAAFAFNQDIEAWDTSMATDMSEMFKDATSFDEPLNGWSTSQVQTFDEMFSSAQVFNQPLDQWDVSQATSMSSMFLQAYQFNQNISSWSTGRVKDFSRMFEESGIQEDVSSWDVSSAQILYRMFDKAPHFNHSLCAWKLFQGSHASVFTPSAVMSMFHSSACMDHNDPQLHGGTVGHLSPMCHICH